MASDGRETAAAYAKRNKERFPFMRVKAMGGPYHKMTFRVEPHDDIIIFPTERGPEVYVLSPPLESQPKSKWTFIHDGRASDALKGGADEATVVTQLRYKGTLDKQAESVGRQ